MPCLAAARYIAMGRSAHSYAVRLAPESSPGKREAFDMILFGPNLDAARATLKIRVMAACRNLACAHACRHFHAAVPGRNKKSIATGIVSIPYCYGEGVAGLVRVVGAFGNGAA